MKRNITYYLAWILVALLSFSGSDMPAQVPSNPIGNNPLSLKWNQIHTDKVQVIFLQGMEEKGLRVAQLAHFFWENQDSTIGSINDKITILVNTQPVSGNGFVTVGPYRSEFYPTPRQFSASHDFLENLTIHEYRHVQQLNNSVQGITKTVRNVLGSWAWGSMLSMALPRWYLEGDAVIAETEYTFSGRGRWAPFLMEYNALIASDKVYGFEKAAAGSIKDFVPSWYHLGYQMLTTGRDKFGDDIWAKVAEDAVRFKGIVFPFSRNLKKRTGWDAKRLYKETMEGLSENWHLSDPTFMPKKINLLPKQTVTHYNNPHFTGDGNWIAVRNSYDELSTIVQIDPAGNEERILAPGLLLQSTMGSVSVIKNKIAWAAYSQDPRWLNRSYSDVYTYDLITGEKNKLTEQGRYFSPEFSKDGNRIAAIRVDQNLNHRLVILSTANGTIEQDIELTEYKECQFPIWDDEGRIILVVSTPHSNLLIRINPLTRETVTLTPEITDRISHPVRYLDKVYFSWGPSVPNNIYALDQTTGEITQVTFSPLGAFQPDISEDGNSLVYAAFTAEGYDIHQLSLSGSGMYQPKSRVPVSSLTRSYPTGEGTPIITVADSFTITRFNKWSGILNPHSLLAEVNHPIASLRLLSDNKFGTMSGEAGAFYNYNEQEWTYGANLIYAELFPVINTGFVHTNRSAAFVNYGPSTDTTYFRQISAREWSENRLGLGMSVPLEWITGNYVQSFRAAANYRYIDLNVKPDFDPLTSAFRDTILYESNRTEVTSVFAEPITSSSFHSLDLGLSFQMIKRRARLNLRPRMGIVVGLRYRATLGDPGFGGNVFSANANLFLPGIGKNQSLRLSTSYQREKHLDNYRYSDVFNYPRGYDLSLRRDQFFTWRIDYMLPLFYPDQAIGPLAFVKRVKANLFYDHGVFKFTEEALPRFSNKIRAIGLELNFDFRAIRLVEVDLGFRYSYLLDDRFALNDKRHVLDFFVVSITQ